MRTPILLTVGALALATLAACGGSDDGRSATTGAGGAAAASGKPGKIAVAATDTSCRAAAPELPAGTTTFTVTN
jgi:iron uptake system component EfeO